MRNCYGFDGPQPVPAGLPAFPGRDCSWAQLEFVLVHTFIFSTCSRAVRGSPTFHESFESVAAPKVHIFHSCPVRVGFRDKLSAARQELIRRNCFHSGGTERERVFVSVQNGTTAVFLKRRTWEVPGKSEGVAGYPRELSNK